MLLVMNKGDQVYRLWNDIQTGNKTIWMNQFLKIMSRTEKFE